jgi:hypothetical protein
MKIDLSTINAEHFNAKSGLVGDEVCYLISPKDFGCEWNKHNLHLRSALVDADGEIISLGQKKFFNYTEKPDLYPCPDSHKDWTILDKLDGSLLTWTVTRKNNLIARTRGTVSARIHDNGYEIDYFLDKYPKIKTCGVFPDYSLLTEWTSPTMKIVLDYGTEPDIVLLDIISHVDGNYLPADKVDEFAKDLGLRRPEKFKFNSLKDIVDNCQTLKGREGYVLAFNGNQNRVKLKGLTYLTLHRFKAQATLENTVDLFFEYGCPSFSDFQNKLKQNFDEDCAALVLGFCSEICDAFKEIDKITEGFRGFIAKNQTLTRKDIALKILNSYGGEGNNRAGFVFKIYDGKTLDESSIKKLLYQVLKNSVNH